MELDRAHEIRELQRAEIARVVTAAERVLVGDLPVRRQSIRRGLVVLLVLVVRAVDASHRSFADAVLLAVADPVGRHELAELVENLGQERSVPAELLGGADEAEHTLDIPCGQS